jgi:hypothetical protein
LHGKIEVTNMSDAKIPEHPLLAKLGVSGATNVTSLRGYVGPATTDAHVRLYASLDDPSESVEFAHNDVLHYAATPDTVLPFGGTIVWLKKDAEVTFHRAERSAAVKADPNALEVNRGRLRIQVRGGGLRSDVCQSRCQVCTSRCQVCTSRCRATIGNFGDIAGLTRFR